jgi:hypothetical protein
VEAWHHRVLDWLGDDAKDDGDNGPLTELAARALAEPGRHL